MYLTRRQSLLSHTDRKIEGKIEGWIGLLQILQQPFFLSFAIEGEFRFCKCSAFLIDA